jgi:anti-anti-sigma factor
MDIVTNGPTVILAGDFDVRSTDEVRRAVYAALAGQDGDVVVDLSEVDNVDVIALRVLAAATFQASRSGQHLRLRGCAPTVRRLIHVSRLIRVLEVERVAASA